MQENLKDELKDFQDNYKSNIKRVKENIKNNQNQDNFFLETYPTRVFANLSTGTDLIRSWDEVEEFLTTLLRALNRDGQFLLNFRRHSLSAPRKAPVEWISLCVTPTDHCGIEGCEALIDVWNIKLCRCNFWMYGKTDNAYCLIEACSPWQPDESNVVDGVDGASLPHSSVFWMKNDILWLEVEILGIFKTEVSRTVL